MQSESVDFRVLQKRLGAFLKRQGAAKEIADLIDCDERTAFKLRAGHAWPIARHWWNIWLEFGDDVVEAVFHPERAEARLKLEAQKREQARQERIASASGLVDVRSFGLAAGLDQGAGAPEDPAELGPPNLDLFEACTFAAPPTHQAGVHLGA